MHWAAVVSANVCSPAPPNSPKGANLVEPVLVSNALLSVVPLMRLLRLLVFRNPDIVLVAVGTTMIWIGKLNFSVSAHLREAIP